MPSKTDYILILTEGPNELRLINVLLEKDLLWFRNEDLVYHQAFHERQLSEATIERIRQLPADAKVRIYRIGDKLSDTFRLPKRQEDRQKLILPVIDVHTTPELEILMIIREGRYEEYLKVKSKMKPSVFYKTVHRGYNKRSDYVEEYFSSLENDDLTSLLREYRKLRGSLSAGAGLTLFDLLSEAYKK